jgi:hypothetical protein
VRDQVTTTSTVGKGAGSRGWLSKLVILGAPLALGLLEVWHFESLPFDVEGELGPFTRYRTIAPVATQWLIVHLLQAPLIALVGLAVYLMVRDLTDLPAKGARVCMALFVVAYTVLDSVDGIAVGVLVANARDLSPGQFPAVEQAIEDLWNHPIVGNISVVTITGAGAWVVGVIAAAISLRRSGAPRGPVALMVLAAFIFGMSHANPTGPIGMACLLAAFVWMEFFPQASLSLGAEEPAPVSEPERAEEPEAAEASPGDRPRRRHRRRHRRR